MSCCKKQNHVSVIQVFVISNTEQIEAEIFFTCFNFHMICFVLLYLVAYLPFFCIFFQMTASWTSRGPSFSMQFFISGYLSPYLFAFSCIHSFKHSYILGYLSCYFWHCLAFLPLVFLSDPSPIIGNACQ